MKRAPETVPDDGATGPEVGTKVWAESIQNSDLAIAPTKSDKFLQRQNVKLKEGKAWRDGRKGAIYVQEPVQVQRLT